MPKRLTEEEKLEIAAFVIDIIDEAKRDSRGQCKIWVNDWMDRAQRILTERWCRNMNRPRFGQ